MKEPNTFINRFQVVNSKNQLIESKKISNWTQCPSVL